MATGRSQHPQVLELCHGITRDKPRRGWSAAPARARVGTKLKHNGKAVTVEERSASTAGNEALVRDGPGRRLRLHCGTSPRTAR
ncbi:hypothetical protein [Streptomyces pinistramenti]|uniref:hypothetical protein n=1 Tax=Streptomyces pinistramenti TaxID=2884812 RepID=UPI001D08720E|nr:hypothetical protein [Streptomyces pinistramenti]MCB5910409.1 hypothetical protein [Streptomyces pinistramenti]